MAPTDKARAAGVSASSFLDLKAELARKEADFEKGVSVPREKKGKGTVWARTNKGVAARAARDVAALAADRHTAESARAALERKAAIYEKLKKGKTGGLSEAQYEALLVDFDAKGADGQFSSDSEDVDESLTVPKPINEEDDPLIEYEDEFGRMRTARRSEVPRDLMPSAQPEDVDPFVVLNPVNHFPVFEPSAERIAAIEKAAQEAEAPLEAHYDASRDVRAKGAAFYSFSADEEARRKEMEALKKAREETEAARKETGAVDVKAGEIEGILSEGGDGKVGKGKDTARSRAMEKRKRELEERRKLVEAKRRKVKGGGGEQNEAPSVTETKAEVDPMAAAEAETTAKAKKSKRRWDQKDRGGAKVAPTTGTNAADNFLAQLEQDLIGKNDKWT